MRLGLSNTFVTPPAQSESAEIRQPGHYGLTEVVAPAKEPGAENATPAGGGRWPAGVHEPAERSLQPGGQPIRMDILHATTVIFSVRWSV